MTSQFTNNVVPFHWISPNYHTIFHPCIPMFKELLHRQLMICSMSPWKSYAWWAWIASTKLYIFLHQKPETFFPHNTVWINMYFNTRRLWPYFHQGTHEGKLLTLMTIYAIQRSAHSQGHLESYIDFMKPRPLQHGHGQSTCPLTSC